MRGVSCDAKLLRLAAEHGATVTTDGRVLRIREWRGPLPEALSAALHLRRRRLYRHLLVSMIVLFDGAPSRLFEGIPSSHSHTL
jgi:hypothetical protein